MARMKNKRKNWLRVVLLIIFTILAIGIDLPKGVKIRIPKPKITFEKRVPFVQVTKQGYLLDYSKNINIKQGLDLQGGSHLVYTVDMSGVDVNQRNDALASLQKVIENRVNAFGVSEPVIYTGKSGNEYRLTVELAGVKDTEQAMNLIGKTAQLDFRELDSAGQDFQKTDLTGSDLLRANVQFNQTTNEPEIALEFNSEGATKFAVITARNIGKPVGIYLDDKLISYPNVNQEITGGKAQITGKFTYTEARDLAIQLDAGRLPMPISVAEQRTVEATLGQDSIHRSIIAGVIGILIVSLFMIIYYRILGVFSTIGLALYLIFSVALFKLFAITLTMGGVAALILSIGMSMETDVLVFERIREELRNGRTFAHAAALGFSRAWTSIRDSNAVSLIICGLLIWAGGSVRGFAIVLAIGIVVGLSTTFFGTKSLIDFIVRYKFVRNNSLFNVEKETVKK
jgi:preprotein translocase subunit SecD